MKSLFKTLFYKPLYNAFIFLLASFPWIDAGMMVIIFTVLVKLLLYPLSKKSIITQLTMKRLEPELALVREKYKDNRQEQSKQMMDFYKKNNLNPFSGLILVLVQFPILVSLYWVFFRAGLPSVNHSLLYSFTHVPAVINMKFLHLINISNKSWLLALIAAFAQYLQIHFSMPPSTSPKGAGFGSDLSRMMQVQMKFIFPIMIFFIAYRYSGVIALYFITSSLFMIAQELFIRHKVLPKLSLVK